MPDRLGAAAAGPLLILAPTGRDAEGAAVLLGREGVTCRTCPDLAALCTAINEDTGAVLVADEAFARTNLDALSQHLGMQPPWSDLPFIILTHAGAAARRATIEMHLPESLGNVVFLERPLNTLSLVSAVRSALRARQRQRQVGAYLAEQERAAAALRESEARFRNMADSAPALIWMSDAGGQLVFANMHYEHMFARPVRAMLGQGWEQDVLADDLPGYREAFRDAFRARRAFRAEWRMRDRDGQVRWLRCEAVPRLDDAGTFLGYTGCAVDITEARVAADALEARVAERTAALTQAVDALHAEALERVQAEEALRQAQKMEAVGQLTGGIAHDFNNLLQAVSGSLELAQGRLDQGHADKLGRYLDTARQAADQAAALTHRLLAFARRQALQPKPVVIAGLVLGMVELIRRTVGPAIEVRTRMGGGTWPVLCDPNQLESALLNLAINARDAMPDGGTLTLSTENVRLGEGDVAGQDARPGDYVEIAVADTGTGMDEVTRARAFEPFFTTKPIGQGTGLGLSQLYGFMKQSSGVVRLDSVPGQGTTVRLYLPRGTNAAEEGAEEAGPGQSDAFQAGAGEAVLLIEDERSVRELATERLRELGYQVLEAADGPAALRLLHAGSRVDLLVTDVGLPGGLNGRQVAEAAREHRPGLPVLFITGYAGSALDDQLAPGMAVLGKPFVLDALAIRVRALLETASVA